MALLDAAKSSLIIGKVGVNTVSPTGAMAAHIAKNQVGGAEMPSLWPDS